MFTLAPQQKRGALDGCKSIGWRAARMHQNRPLLCLASCLAVGALHAQAPDPGIIARKVNAHACSASDSLIGTHGEWVKAELRGSWRSDLDVTAINATANMEKVHKHPPGVQEIWPSVQFRGLPPKLDPGLSVTVAMPHSNAPADSTLPLILILDDTLVLGPGTARLSTGMPELGITDHRDYTAHLSPPGFRAVAKAQRIAGALAADSFQLSPKSVQSFRALYVAAVCGWPVNQ